MNGTCSIIKTNQVVWQVISVIKVKVSPIQSCPALGGKAHLSFLVEGASVLKRHFHITKVVPISLLALTCFRTARLAGDGADNRAHLIEITKFQ